MYRYLMRPGLTSVVGLSLTLIAGGLHAQSQSQNDTSRDAGKRAADELRTAQESKAAKEAAAESGNQLQAKLKKDLDLKEKQLNELRESMRKLQAELKPVRDKKQYQEDLAQLDQQSGFLSRELRPSEARIHAELEKPTTLEFISTPLEDVVLYLKDYHKVEILLDRHALEQAGISTDTPVTLALRGVSLRSALALVMRGLGLTFVIDDEVVQITTRQEAARRFETRTYDVSRLLGESGRVGELIEVVQALLPASQDEGEEDDDDEEEQDDDDDDDDEEEEDDDSVPMKHVVTGYRNLLIVRSNTEGHADLERLLHDIARGLKNEQRSKAPAGGKSTLID